RAAETERVADREHPVTDTRLAVRELGKLEVAAAIDLDQVDVSSLIGANDLGVIGLAVVSRDLHLVRAIDHVIVGDGIAVGRNEEARSLAGYRTTPWAAKTWHPVRTALTAEPAEEALHRR